MIDNFYIPYSGIYFTPLLIYLFIRVIVEGGYLVLRLSSIAILTTVYVTSLTLVNPNKIGILD